jgi:hypothetical protein
MTGVTGSKTMDNDETLWNESKANAVRVVNAPGPKFFVQTAYLAAGARVVRSKCHSDGYVTVQRYKR